MKTTKRPRRRQAERKLTTGVSVIPTCRRRRFLGDTPMTKQQFQLFVDQLERLHERMDPGNWPLHARGPVSYTIPVDGRVPTGGGFRRMLVAGECAE